CYTFYTCRGFDASLVRESLAPAPQPHQGAKGQHHPWHADQQEPFGALQLAAAHHQPVLDNWPRFQALQQLRLIEQPVDRKSSKILIDARLDLAINQK